MANNRVNVNYNKLLFFFPGAENKNTFSNEINQQLFYKNYLRNRDRIAMEKGNAYEPF
jgi:hypothetical protein